MCTYHRIDKAGQDGEDYQRSRTPWDEAPNMASLWDGSCCFHSVTSSEHAGSDGLLYHWSAISRFYIKDVGDRQSTIAGWGRRHDKSCAGL